jgi:hypothetical protein
MLHGRPWFMTHHAYRASPLEVKQSPTGFLKTLASDEDQLQPIAKTIFREKVTQVIALAPFNKDNFVTGLWKTRAATTFSIDEEKFTAMVIFIINNLIPDKALSGLANAGKSVQNYCFQVDVRNVPKKNPERKSAVTHMSIPPINENSLYEEKTNDSTGFLNSVWNLLTSSPPDKTPVQRHQVTNVTMLPIDETSHSLKIADDNTNLLEVLWKLYEAYSISHTLIHCELSKQASNQVALMFNLLKDKHKAALKNKNLETKLDNNELSTRTNAFKLTTEQAQLAAVNAEKIFNYAESKKYFQIKKVAENTSAVSAQSQTRQSKRYPDKKTPPPRTRLRF